MFNRCLTKHKKQEISEDILYSYYRNSFQKAQLWQDLNIIFFTINFGAKLIFWQWKPLKIRRSGFNGFILQILRIMMFNEWKKLLESIKYKNLWKQKFGCYWLTFLIYFHKQLKELQNCIPLRSLFCSNGFIQVCILYLSFWKTSVLLPVFFFCSVFWIWFHLYRLNNICIIIIYIDVGSSVILFLCWFVKNRVVTHK